MSSPTQLARLRPRLSAGLETLSLDLGEPAIDRLIQYLELLVQWNQAYNLSAIRDPDDMLGKHLFDALAMAPHWHSGQIADMGSGAGLPVTLRVLERLGGVAICYGHLSDGTRFCASLPGDVAVREGETISIAIDPSDCHVFAQDGRVMRRQNAPALTA